LLTGTKALRDVDGYPLVIEPLLVVTDQTVEFCCLSKQRDSRITLLTSNVYREATAPGVFSESMAVDIVAFRRAYRAKTYYALLERIVGELEQ